MLLGDAKKVLEELRSLVWASQNTRVKESSQLFSCWSTQVCVFPRMLTYAHVCSRVPVTLLCYCPRGTTTGSPPLNTKMFALPCCSPVLPCAKWTCPAQSEPAHASQGIVT
jgi:hypothetical protein